MDSKSLSDRDDLIDRIAWELHKCYCTLPGVCSTPDEVDRAAARKVLAIMGVKAGGPINAGTDPRVQVAWSRYK